MTERPRPPFIIAAESVPEQPARYPNSDEVLASGRAIGKAAGLRRIGLHVERVAPGQRTSWPHAEEDEEEFVFVLEGEISAWIDGEIYPMKKGDLAAFPCGTGISHTFINDGDEDAILIVGGERGKSDSRIFYPLNPERKNDMPWSSWWDDAPTRPLGPHDGVPRRR